MQRSLLASPAQGASVGVEGAKMSGMAENAVQHTTAAGLDLYGAIGGAATCRGLSTAFYARVQQDPLLRPLFPGKTLHCAIEEFAAFLAQFFGGPPENAQRRWWVSLRESHLRFRIGPRERAAWISNMIKALDDIQMEEPVRAALCDFFERSSAYVANIGEAPPDPKTAIGPGGAMHQEIARRWDAQREIDETVAAVRAGDAERAITLAESATLRACFERNRSLIAGVLGVMIRSGNEALLRYVRDRITADPVLAHEHYAGRTLLHEASARGNPTLVKLLLDVGADPNAMDGGGHTPLYSVANECTNSEAGRVIRALAECGANVNADGGVKRCTALHMAARRGNVAAAEALLDCGADIEARDSLGETPLRRSVNCGKIQVARLLLNRGADVHSKGSKSLTPLLAARTTAMKQLLQSPIDG